MKLPRAHHLSPEILAGQLLCLRLQELPFNRHQAISKELVYIAESGHLSGIAFEKISAPIVHFYSHLLARTTPLPPFFTAALPFSSLKQIPEMTSFSSPDDINKMASSHLLIEIADVLGKESRALGLNMLINAQKNGQQTLLPPVRQTLEAELSNFGIVMAARKDQASYSNQDRDLIFFNWAENIEFEMEVLSTEKLFLWVVTLEQHSAAHGKLVESIGNNTEFKAIAEKQVEASLHLRKQLYRKRPAQHHPGRMHKWLSHPDHLKISKRVQEGKKEED